MSFRVGQFSTGFELSSLGSAAQRFAHLVGVRGGGVVIVSRTRLGMDDYGNPTFTETTIPGHAMIERNPSEESLAAGESLRETVILYMGMTSPVEEKDQIMLDGLRYEVKTIDRTEAYLKVTAERRLNG